MGAMAASGIVSISPGTITDSFRVLMPQRWLNLSILCFLPVLIGALSWRKYSDAGWSMLLMIAVVVFFRYEFGRDFPIPILSENVSADSVTNRVLRYHRLIYPCY